MDVQRHQDETTTYSSFPITTSILNTPHPIPSLYELAEKAVVASGQLLLLGLERTLVMRGRTMELLKKTITLEFNKDIYILSQSWQHGHNPCILVQKIITLLIKYLPILRNNDEGEHDIHRETIALNIKKTLNIILSEINKKLEINPYITCCDMPLKTNPSQRCWCAANNNLVCQYRHHDFLEYKTIYKERYLNCNEQHDAIDLKKKVEKGIYFIDRLPLRKCNVQLLNILIDKTNSDCASLIFKFIG